ncbi:hypothetical protein LEP1GSC133_4983 [Leptospira borgpetersenii serovar Pomona str. 200901868]|uniref:Uncharacterized protein n=1 Tax=Leptospira borgpetersenii serovar Pomona str. 200901868 TaxID=1192866 RepID=M6WAA0_LEPBO|nr:hypothetical protein LEP1GSC133_4983 [Leptospira borgpetersenii serovar Pomona str. 200901868]
MNWVEETLLYFFIIYAGLQFLVSGPVLQLLINFFRFVISNFDGFLPE